MLVPEAEFTFFFGQRDVDSNYVPGPSWGFGAEEIATSNMFNRVPSKSTGFVIDRIDLRLDYTPGDDVWIKEVGGPGNHDGEDWYERTVTYNMTITAGDETFISTDIRASFVIKQVDVNGTMTWKIVAWYDDIGSTLYPTPPFARSTNTLGLTDRTWGAIKSIFS